MRLGRREARRFRLFGIAGCRLQLVVRVRVRVRVMPLLLIVVVRVRSELGVAHDHEFDEEHGEDGHEYDTLDPTVLRDRA